MGDTSPPTAPPDSISELPKNNQTAAFFSKERRFFKKRAHREGRQGETEVGRQGAVRFDAFCRGSMYSLIIPRRGQSVVIEFLFSCRFHPE